MLNKTTLLFLVILIEGYVVLACELLAIRQLIPFVGSGTETISIVISAVLLPLAVGYHWGGKAYSRAWRRAAKSGSKRLSIRKLLIHNILSSLIVLMIGLSYIVMEIFFQLMGAFGITHRLPQTAIYTGLFLVYPVFLLGQTVPLISNYFSRRKLSEVTGKMLFFSTTGSFLGSVFSTIVLMSFIGVHNTVIVTLGLLALLGIILCGRRMVFESLMFICILAFIYVLNGSGAMSTMNIISNNAYNTVSITHNEKEESKILQINRSWSSKIAKDRSKFFDYIRFIQHEVIDMIPLAPGERADILIIGSGGFTLGIDDTHNRYTFVDIDRDLKDVAEKYFLPEPLSPNKKFVAASAREFVRRDKNQYDFILIDVYTNVMSIPMETITRDFLVDVKRLVKPDGILAANIIMNPGFYDTFSARYHNTFTSVFPIHMRHVIGEFDVWNQTDGAHVANVIYFYFNHPLSNDRTLYTDDKNTYSLDRR